MTTFTSPAAERLRTTIDRRVMTARIVHGLGILGRIGCVAACVWATALFAGRISGGGDARLVACTVLAATAAAAWLFSRRASGSWPSRLSIALAAEQAQPEVGERISRAIDFLDEPTLGRTGSAALKAIAIEQASDAAGRIGTAPIEGAARHLGFAAAAAVALSLLTIAAPRHDAATAPAIVTTQTREVASATASLRPAFDPRSEAGRAAARIAALAAFERRLAASLAGWFAEAPGLAAIDVPSRRRLAIDEAATLHEDCLAVVSSAANVIAAAEPTLGDATTLRKAMADLAADADAAQTLVSAAIRDHRLARAAEAARHLADQLAEVTSLLGIPMADVANQAILERPPLDGQERASLDRDSSRLIDRLAQLDRAVASASTTESLGAPEPGVASQSAAPVGAAAGPGGGAPAEASPDGLAPAADGIDRVWSLVPEQSLPLRPRAADAATFPSHRQAIDAYYRLLLEQTRRKP